MVLWHPGAMGSRCSPDTQLCCYTKYEAKQAEERKRDEDWANCLPPMEDMWAMKKRVPGGLGYVGDSVYTYYPVMWGL